MFEWMFGKRLTPQEQMRKRELDREKIKLQNQEKKLVQEIKKSAKNNQMKTVKIQARDLIRTKKQVEKFDKMKVQLQAISLRIQTMRSSTQMTTSMREATRMLNGMNRTMNLPALQKITMEFTKANDVMDQKQEMMDDAMDDIMDDELDMEDEEEIDEVVNKVLDEIGVDLTGKLKDAPVGTGQLGSLENPVEQKAQLVGADGAGDFGDDDLQARLNSLKRG
ncbi:hypothetical protein B5S31_g3640 [[Candida] boidinii]|nr:hypothetical protein B5S29_g3158 [[Candida] boidinii]OWB73874.1 hypothetical protein B5S31_g3640 [[Candida] boidinii]OWB78490.1 hypothetical protein B5S32_g2686 [[Candida] boidinii]